MLGQVKEKTKVAAISVTGYEQDIYKVKPDLKLIKWGIGLIIVAEVMPLMKSFLLFRYLGR